MLRRSLDEASGRNTGWSEPWNWGNSPGTTLTRGAPETRGPRPTWSFATLVAKVIANRRRALFRVALPR